MGLFGLLFKDPLAFVILAVPLLYSIIAHEVAHGLVANLLGDDTAKRFGRLSLNPAVHIDPLGLLMLFLVGFGWAKPVPIDYGRFRNQRSALLLVSIAGCVANIMIATIAIALLQAPAVYQNRLLSSILFMAARINIVLGAFNLLPIPPLDGSKLILGFLPPRLQARFVALEPFGIFLLIALLYSGALEGVITVVERTIMLLISVLLVPFR